MSRKKSNPIKKLHWIKNLKKSLEAKRRYSYYLMCFCILLVYIIFNAILGDNEAELKTKVQTLMKLLVFGIIIIGAYFIFQPGDKSKRLLAYAMAIGMLMRVGYMLYTPSTIRSHDLGTISSLGSGHAGYILQLLEGGLPASNMGQYYHPPLFHGLAALMIKLAQLFLPNQTAEQHFEAAKLVSCFASCGVLLLIADICSTLKLKTKATLIAVTTVAFLPNFYLLAGRVNNDALSIFFMTLILLYTIKWYEDNTMKNTVVLGLAFGLGMMTKLSVGGLAFFSGGVMLIKGFEALRKKELYKVLAQYGVFALVCFPIALWYPLRNLVCFNQPLMYVYEIKNPGDMYCGQLSFFERFMYFPIQQLLSPIYNNPMSDRYALLYLLKGALFGEFSFGGGRVMAQLLIVSFLGLSLLTIGSMLYFLIHYNKSQVWRIALPSAWASLYISYILFNLRYPYTCTMDFRYIVPTAVLGAIFTAAVSEILPQNTKALGFRLYNISLIALLFSYSLLSIVIYCTV